MSLASESARVSPFSRELESNTGCEQGLVENASATAKSPVCERCDGPHASSACPHFKEQRDDHPDAQRRKCLALGSDGPQTHSVASFLPDRLSYPEWLPERFHASGLYTDKEQLYRRLRDGNGLVYDVHASYQAYQSKSTGGSVSLVRLFS